MERGKRRLLSALIFATIFVVGNVGGLSGAQPKQTPLQGLTWMVGKNQGEYLTGPEIERVLEKNPHISGILLHRQWSDLEPSRGNFRWEILDGAVEAARKAGRSYKLLLRPGVGTPEWVYEAGCTQFDTVGPNPHRKDTYNKPLRIPVPWDPIFLKEFERFIAAVGARYSNDPLCRAVALTGANFQSGEAHLPKNGPSDLEKWEKLDYRTNLPKAYRAYIDLFSKAFPNQQICLHVSVPIKNDDGAMEAAAEYGSQRIPDRFTLQNCQLSGKSDNSGLYSYALIKSYLGKVHVGYQSLAFINLKEEDERMGNPQVAVFNFVKGRGEYWEVWDTNGRNPELCRWLRDEIARAREMGAEAYGAMLMEKGLLKPQSKKRK